MFIWNSILTFCCRLDPPGYLHPLVPWWTGWAGESAAAAPNFIFSLLSLLEKVTVRWPFPLLLDEGKKWTKKINLISQLYENSPNKSVDRKNNFPSTRTPKNNNDQKEPGKTPKITNNIKQIQGISVERKEFKKNPEKYQLKTKQRKQHTMLWLLNCWNDDVS